MRLVPRSLFGRLAAIAAVSTLAALIFASFAIGHVLERLVMRGLDDRLDAQVMVLMRAIRPDGTLDPARAIDLPGFGEAGSGWTWQVVGPGGRRWASAAGDSLPEVPPPPPDGRDRHHRRDGPGPGEGHGPTGQRLHFRTVTVESGAGPVTISAGAPRRVAEVPLREAMLPLLGSLAALGIGLAIATLVQLRIGLRPLAALQASLGDIIAGRRRHVPIEQPLELVPLATELNRLIDQNESGLAHARRHVANLAHGLKTPLASLGLRLAEEGRDPDGSLAALVGSIDRRVSHHLRRARAAAPGGAGRTLTALAPAIADLVGVLHRIHADRRLRVEIDLPAGCTVALDGQDLDEMAGNLLDNAWRHARAAIRIGASIRGGMVVLLIEDDGAGLDADELAEALLPGRRIDESGPGHGFGLPITQELAQLNGGNLALSRSPTMKGLCAQLSLPQSRAR